jgi:hypothetical protein
MTNLQKTYTRPQPLTKNQLREMLAQAVRNTQPKPKRPSKARKDQV